jgi:hypothetical protein
MLVIYKYIEEIDIYMLVIYKYIEEIDIYVGNI